MAGQGEVSITDCRPEGPGPRLWHDHAMLGRRETDVIPAREVLDTSVTSNCTWLEGRSWFKVISTICLFPAGAGFELAGEKDIQEGSLIFSELAPSHQCS